LTLGDVAASGTATLSLTGAGSRVSIGAAAATEAGLLPVQETAVTVSDTGNSAKLAIYNGNKLQNGGNGYVGVAAGETGSVVVSGAGSAWNNGGNVTIGSAGTATLTLADGGTVSAGGVLSIGQLGTVTGNGTITGNTMNSGLAAPGLSVGSLMVAGNYSQTATGKSQFELAGNLAGQFDQLTVTGSANISGKLVVLLGSNGGNPFTPQLGNTFDVLTATGGVTGGFSAYLLPALSPGLMWNVHTSPLAVTLSVSLAGDYNHNGIVDAADYSIWRDTLGSTSDIRADGDNNGMVNPADYNVWKLNFGATGGAGAAGHLSPQLLSVPEPPAAPILLGLLAIPAIFGRRCASIFSHSARC
jgi:autotransporter family porin